MSPNNVDEIVFAKVKIVKHLKYTDLTVNNETRLRSAILLQKKGIDKFHRFQIK